MALEGYSWGIATNPEPNITEYDWDAPSPGWLIKETTNPARYSTPWGDLQMLIDEEFVSPVMDKGDATSQFIWVTMNKTYARPIELQWRGQATDFNEEAVSPAWENYPSGGANKDWRYIQIKVQCLEQLYIGDQPLTIGGEPLGI